MADIVRRHGPAYLAKFGARMPPSHKTALWDIEHCRTPALGGTSSSYTSSYTSGVATTAPSSAYTSVNDRKVIMTASVSLETSKVDDTVSSIRNIAQGAGGYVQSSSSYGQHTGSTSCGGMTVASQKSSPWLCESLKVDLVAYTVPRP